MEPNKTFYKYIALVLAAISVGFSVALFLKTNRADVQLTLPFLAGVVFPVLLLVLMLWVVISHNIQKTDRKESQEPISFATNPDINTVAVSTISDELVDSLTVKLKNKPSVEKFSEQILIAFSKKYAIVQGMIFTLSKDDDKFHPSANYAYYSNEVVKSFSYGEGISGQVAKNKELLYISNVPEGYITVLSGLGSSSPKHLLIMPFVYEGKTVAIAEFASFGEFSQNIRQLYERINADLASEFNRFLA
jgi:hypothetical protein